MTTPLRTGRGIFHWLLEALAIGIVFAGRIEINGATPAGSAVQLSGSDSIRTAWVGDAFYDFTFDLWFKPTTGGVLIGEVDEADASDWDYALAEISSAGSIRASVPGISPIDVGNISFGSWHHLALVYSDSNKQLSTYLDGTLTGSSIGTRQMPNAWHYVYCIGRGGPTNLGSGGFLSGFVDEVRLWNRALSEGEITFQYNKTINVNDPALRYYWHFDSLVAGKTYLSPATLDSHEAIHIPQTPFQLVSSTAPISDDPRPKVLSVSGAPVASGTGELRATVNPNGTETTVYFEFSKGANLLERTPIRSIGGGTNAILITQVVGGLEIGSGYNYHLVASNAFGVINSFEGSFAPSSWAGYAYQFNFSVVPPGSYLQTTKDQGDFFDAKSITVELWFSMSHPGTLVLETDPTGQYIQQVIQILHDDTAKTDTLVAALNGLPKITMGQVSSNVWNHVALRYDANAQTLDGFLNGIKRATTTGVRITPKELGFQEKFLFGPPYFLGAIDEIRVWNVARSDEDLTSARFNLLAGDESGLVLNWRGANTGTDLVPDFGPRGNDGQNVDCAVISSTAPLVFNVRRNGDSYIETQFALKAGTPYRLETSGDLMFWTAISTNTAPESGYVRLPEATSDLLKFYRVVAQ